MSWRRAGAVRSSRHPSHAKGIPASNSATTCPLPAAPQRWEERRGGGDDLRDFPSGYLRRGRDRCQFPAPVRSPNVGALDGFWHFAGSFWWLLFPFGGAIVAVSGRAWRELKASSRERHERTMERLRLRQGIGSQVTGAADAALGASSLGQSGNDDSVARLAHLDCIMAEHDAVNARWLDYELDVTKLIDFFAHDGCARAADGWLPQGQRLADSLRPGHEQRAAAAQEDIERYRGAVTDYRVCFDIAEAEAHRVRDRDFSEGERERLERARHPITLSVDRAATPAER